MIKIIPEYGVNAVTLSYECIGVNELSHVWYDPYGNELGTDDTVTVYENGIYSIEITDLNNNKFKGYYINNTPIFEIGCGYSENNVNIFYYPEDQNYWNFNKWKFTFDFTALTSENKPMFYILYRDVQVFEFGAKYCKSGGVLCNYNYTGSHHCELSANIQNMTLNVTIDNTLVKTFNNVKFYPECIQFQSIYNGYEGISYNFKVDNLKIYRE